MNLDFDPYRYQNAALQLCQIRGVPPYETQPDYVAQQPVNGFVPAVFMPPMQIENWKIVAREIHFYKKLKDEMDAVLHMVY